MLLCPHNDNETVDFAVIAHVLSSALNTERLERYFLLSEGGLQFLHDHISSMTCSSNENLTPVAQALKSFPTISALSGTLIELQEGVSDEETSASDLVICENSLILIYFDFISFSGIGAIA